MTKYLFDSFNGVASKTIPIMAFSLWDAERQFDVHYGDRWHWYRIYVPGRSLALKVRD